MTFKVRRLGPDDFAAVLAAAEVFDDPPDPAATRAFLADERHHLLLAYAGETAIGMVTAVELLHPDKPRPEMFIYELGVLDAGSGEAWRAHCSRISWRCAVSGICARCSCSPTTTTRRHWRRTARPAVNAR